MSRNTYSLFASLCSSLLVVAWIFVAIFVPSSAAFRSSFQRGSLKPMATARTFVHFIHSRPSLLLHKKQVSPLVFERSVSNLNSLHAKSGDNNDDEDNDVDAEPFQQRRDGMAQAFRDLDALSSLGAGAGNDDPQQIQKMSSSSQPRTTPLVNIIDAATTASTTKVATPEEEVKMYAQMVQELEENKEDDMYSNVLTEMGGKVSSSTNPPSSKRVITTTSTSSTTTSSPPPMDEAWMNQALQEALDEAKKTSPTDFDRQSVLNDQELMKEIVQVFDQAHDKLIAGLDEIRNEQAQWTAEQSSASFENSKVEQEYRDSAERLTQAESTLTSLLGNVQKETQSVEEAVQELKLAQEDLNKDFLLQLKQAGIVKQVTLVGALLFTMRTIGFVLTDAASPGALPAILVQAAIAVVFAVAYTLIK